MKKIKAYFNWYIWLYITSKRKPKVSTYYYPCNCKDCLIDNDVTLGCCVNEDLPMCKGCEG